MTFSLAAGAVSSAVVCALLVLVLVPVLQRAQVVDVPVHRSLHVAPVPRGGGLAVELAVFVCALIAPVVAGRTGAALPTAQRLDVVVLGVLVVLAFGLLGLAEDLYNVSARARLGAQVLLGAALGVSAVLMTGASWWLVVPVALCTAALVNVTNFMDGANGLAAGHAVVACAWYLVVSLVTPALGLGLGFVSVALGGACLGFLPFNAVRPRVFLGDTGSYALGGAWAFAATVCLLSLPARQALVGVAPLLVLVADTGYTMLMRARAGQRLSEPHKLHVYQRLVTGGWPHRASASLVAGAAALCCAACAPLLLHPGRVTLAAAVVLVGLVLVGYVSLPVLLGMPRAFPRARMEMR